MTARTESPDPDPFIQAEIVQLSQNIAVSLWMRTTDSEELSGSLDHSIKRNMTSDRTEEGAKSVPEVRAERDDWSKI